MLYNDIKEFQHHFVFVYLGNVPDYSIQCFEQIRLWNPTICIYLCHHKNGLNENIKSSLYKYNIIDSMLSILKADIVGYYSFKPDFEIRNYSGKDDEKSKKIVLNKIIPLVDLKMNNIEEIAGLIINVNEINVNKENTMVKDFVNKFNLRVDEYIKKDKDFIFLKYFRPEISSPVPVGRRIREVRFNKNLQVL
jgi:hypothetical protein